jgi:hypothetical protein
MALPYTCPVVDNGYWLAAWLDENGITSRRDARRFLRKRKHFNDLLDVISSVGSGVSALDSVETAVVAGTTIDLSGNMGCSDPKCLRADVDKLFTRVWHYFDLIAVEGLSPAHAQEFFSHHTKEHGLELFLGFVENFFYVRSIGAEGMLVYGEKPQPSFEHLQEQAQQYGVASIIEERGAWIDSFAARAEVTDLEQHSDHWHYAVTHPEMEHTSWGVARPSDLGGRPTNIDIFGEIFDEYVAVLISDIGWAKTLGAPLGAAAMIHEDLLARGPESSLAIRDAMFSLELPVLDGLATKDLIKLRQDNWEYFDAFRLALQTAAQDYIRIAVAGTRADDIAAQIESDVIEPELIRLRRELRVSADILTRKSVASLPLGALATTIGLLDKIPLVAVGGTAVVAAAGIGSFLTDYKKYADDKRSVMMSDMYFLWRAQRIAHRRRR